MASLFKKILSRKPKSEPAKQEPKKEAEQVAGKQKAGKVQKTAPTPRKISSASKKSLARAYSVIKEPHITEKAAALSEQNKYVFKIFPKANKLEVQKAIQSIYDVHVEKVHIVHVAPKRRRVGRHQGWQHGLKHGYKKAIVTLKKGEKIESF